VTGLITGPNEQRLGINIVAVVVVVVVVAAVAAAVGLKIEVAEVRLNFELLSVGSDISYLIAYQ